MDELDKRILILLEKNARASNLSLAKKLRVSEGTVRNRLASLVKEKIIHRFTIETASKAGFRVIVLMQFNPQKPTAALVRFLLSLEGVKGVREVSGAWDVVCEIAVDSPEDYNGVVEKIRTFDGVQKTESLIVLKSS